MELRRHRYRAGVRHRVHRQSLEAVCPFRDTLRFATALYMRFILEEEEVIFRR